jgi:hypothetical protein
MEQDPPDTPDPPRPPQPATPAPADPGGVNLNFAQRSPHPTVLVIDTTADEVNIVVSESRLRLVLTEHASRLSSNWVAPLGIFVTLGIALITSEFKSTRFGLTAGTWETIFFAAVAVAAVWSLVALRSRFALGARKRRIDACVKDIKETKAEGTAHLQR